MVIQNIDFSDSGCGFRAGQIDPVRYGMRSAEPSRRKATLRK